MNSPRTITINDTALIVEVMTTALWGIPGDSLPRFVGVEVTEEELGVIIVVTTVVVIASESEGMSAKGIGTSVVTGCESGSKVPPGVGRGELVDMNDLIHHKMRTKALVKEVRSWGRC